MDGGGEPKIVAKRFLAVLDATSPVRLRDAVDQRPLPADVALDGIAQHGAAGPLRAPISGQPCVWYRCFTSPFLENARYQAGMRPHPAQAPAIVASSGFAPVHKGSGRGAGPQVEESLAPFLICDGTASVIVDPATVIVDTAVVTMNDLRRRADGRADAVLQEWILPAGHAVHAFGSMGGSEQAGAERAAAALVPGSTGSALVSTHDAGYLRGRAETGARLPSQRLILLVLIAAPVIAMAVIALVLFA